jgi:hypothetical protein
LDDTQDSGFQILFLSNGRELAYDPSPCFTAGGLTTINVEMEPMENVILHPTLSDFCA